MRDSTVSICIAPYIYSQSLDVDVNTKIGMHSCNVILLQCVLNLLYYYNVLYLCDVVEVYIEVYIFVYVRRIFCRNIMCGVLCVGKLFCISCEFSHVYTMMQCSRKCFNEGSFYMICNINVKLFIFLNAELCLFLLNTLFLNLFL